MIRIKVRWLLNVLIGGVCLLLVSWIRDNLRNIEEKTIVQPVMTKVTSIINNIEQEMQSYDDSSFMETESTSSETLRTPQVKKKRSNLIIVGYDRSGTTFTTQAFNNDPSMFTIYEPLWFPRDWYKSNHSLNQSQAIIDTTNSIMRCDFKQTEFAKRFVRDISNLRLRIRLTSTVLSSPPFCKVPFIYRTCTEIDPDQLGEICLNDYKHSVTKLASVRLPQRHVKILTEILAQNKDIDIRIVHLVRDPRAVTNSRMNAGWFPELTNRTTGQFKAWCRESCAHVQQNVEFFRDAPVELKKIYKLVKYEDLAADPLGVFEDIYNFAGFEMTDATKEWIIRATNLTKKEIETHKAHKYSIKRNATASIEQWKMESSELQIRYIEENCQPLMKLLGYQTILDH